MIRSRQGPFAPAGRRTVPALAPVHAAMDHVTRITVCTRPFRAAGPRLEAEQLGAKLVVHNYGHGGSGWSLSWGSAERAMELAGRASGHAFAGQAVAVVGAGALGLTLATRLQQAGASVTLYARESPEASRSFRATGSWTPDSRIAQTSSMSGSFAAEWERMARTSWRSFARYRDRPDTPVEFLDQYTLSDVPPAQAEQDYAANNPLGFATLRGAVGDMTRDLVDFGPGEHPFPTRYARRDAHLTFNISTLVQTLVDDFLRDGGTLTQREFHTAAKLLTLPETLIFNCTGYAARALFNDSSLVPVRGQIAWLPVQPEVRYGFMHGTLRMLSRRDGIVVQLSEQDDATGWQNEDESADPHEAEAAIAHLRAVTAAMKCTPAQP